MQFEIATPFGPAIYKSTLSEDEVAYLQEIADITRKEDVKRGHSLAGNINTQLTAIIEDVDKFTAMLAPHIQKYSEHNRNKYKKSLFGNNWTVIEEMSFEIENRGPWINYQKQYEWNPIHSHSGVMSAIIYINIPEDIDKEKETIPLESNTRCPGELGFVHADDGIMNNIHVIPKTGDFYLFPANLSHCVYPFMSDVERISMSFNVSNIEIYKEKEIQ
jgi:hypothetical protein